MKTFGLLAFSVCGMGLASLSHAAQMIASPPIFGSSGQTTAECFIRNIATPLLGAQASPPARPYRGFR